MLLPLERVKKWYESILKKVKNPNKSHKLKIIILVSLSVDSITSLRILVFLLKNDLIPYEIIPVSNYDQVDSQVEKSKEDKDNIVGFVFINCTGDKDLTKYWFCSPDGKNITALVVDSLRPSHHANIWNNNCIVIIDDNMYNYGICPTEKDMKLIGQKDLKINSQNNDEKNNENEDNKDENESKSEKNSEKNDEDKEEDEDNEDNSQNNEGNKNKKKLKNHILNEGDNNNNTNNEADSFEDDIESKARKSNDESNSNANNNQNEEEKEINLQKSSYILSNVRVSQYYSGSYYGLPSTYIFYCLSHQLNKENTNNVWCLIVSLTDMYLRHHISDNKYEEMYNVIMKEVIRINKKNNGGNNFYSSSYTSSNNLNNNDNTISLLDLKKKHQFPSSQKPVKTILIGPDYRLFLYRQWTLYDSFIYSPYTMGALRTYKEPGKEQVSQIFSYMGIPVSEAKQKFTYMKCEFQRIFREKILEISKKFALNELIFNSFVYQFDANTEISASDFAYLVSSIIELPIEKLKNIEVEEKDMEEDLTPSSSLSSFWLAYRLLSLKNLGLIPAISSLALNLQLNIAENAAKTIQNRYRDIGFFKLCSVGGITGSEGGFASPGTFERLAVFIGEAASRGGDKKMAIKPYILSYTDEDKKTVLLIGNIGINKNLEEERNKFPMIFDYVSKKKNIKISYIFTNNDIILLHKDDLYQFIEEIAKLDINNDE